MDLQACVEGSGFGRNAASAAARQEAHAWGQAGRGCGRVDIAERPEIVEEKSWVGDWEGDMIVGARHRGAVLLLVDPHLQVHVAGPDRRQDGRGNGRSDVQAS